MNIHKSQQGSGLLIIVIILAVALVGAVGYIFWQNFFQTKTDEVVDTSSSKTLTISEWGIEGTYKGDDTLDYTVIEKNELGSYSLKFTSSKITGTSCEYAGTTLTRSTGDQMVFITGGGQEKSSNIEDNDVLSKSGAMYSGMKHIGDNYYSYSSPISTCPGSDKIIQADLDQIVDESRQFILSMVEL